MIFFEQFMLAQVAAVLGIVGETLDLQFLRLHNKVTDSFLFAERRCLVQLPLGKEQLRAVTAIALSPSVSCATFNKNVESTPLEKATATLPSSRRYCRNASNLSIYVQPRFSTIFYTPSIPLEVGFNVKRKAAILFWIFARLWYNFWKKGGGEMYFAYGTKETDYLSRKGQAASGSHRADRAD